MFRGTDLLQSFIVYVTIFRSDFCSSKEKQKRGFGGNESNLVGNHTRQHIQGFVDLAESFRTSLKKSRTAVGRGAKNGAVTLAEPFKSRTGRIMVIC